MNSHLISLMIFLPALGALVQAMLPARFAASRGRAAVSLTRVLALGASLSSSLIAIILVVMMHTQTAEPQLGIAVPWIESYAINYDVGLDGLNALMVILIALVFPVLIAVEWKQKFGVRGMHGLFLILQTAFLGAVCSQDLFLQFFFWALSAMPFYFLIGIWGGEARESAASRTVIASAIGNALFFCALILIYYSVDPHSFSIHELAGGKLNAKTFDLGGLSLPVSTVAYALAGVGLALRIPIWPLHGWFTFAAEEAPLSVLIALAAVGAPVGTYLFMRLGYSLFPETMFESSNVIVIIGIVNFVIAGLCAIAQKTLRMLLAFLCMTGIGFILLGVGSLNAAGAVGAVYQQLMLGLGIAGFGLFSNLIQDRVGHTEFLSSQGKRNMSGIALLAPILAWVAGVVLASLIGFPGAGGFVSYSLLLIGGYSVHPLIILISGIALLLVIYCLFGMFRNVFMGKAMVLEGGGTFEDTTLRERIYLLPIVTALLVFGLYPKPLIDLLRPTVLTLLSTIK